MVEKEEDQRAVGETWDVGLRAAFGPDPTWTGRGGVLALLEEGSGAGAGVLLRDVPDEPPGPVATAAGAEAPAGLGRYQVDGEIARGGVGVVLRGRDVDLGREVALKVLRAEHVGNPAMIRRLVAEAQIGGQLHHPAVL